MNSRSPASGDPVRFQKSISWIEKHNKDYQGYWVALDGDSLVGYDRNRATLLESLRQDARFHILNQLLFIKIQEDPCLRIKSKLSQ
jgi:hypothetical protein